MKNNSDSIFSCGCMLVFAAMNLFFGGASVNYLLVEFVGKTMPMFWAVVTGLFVGEFTIPVAVVVWILKFTGIL